VKPVAVEDIGHLPTYAFGPRVPLWWGTLGFMVIEGLGFVFAVGTYFYLASQNASWPIDSPPGLLWSGLLTSLLILSEVPNRIVKRWARELDLGRVRLGVGLMALIGLAAIGLRFLEFGSLNTRWDWNAYGSVVWALIALHTTHLITDVAETIIIWIMLMVGPIDGRRFVDVFENQQYWDFVVLTWLQIYATLYWVPRWIGPGG
jgi:heme/copper-type cytochrome/quinol oxidase subunit 3